MNKRLYYKLYFLKNSIFPNHVYAEEKKNIQRRASFYQQFIKPHELVFDVGANIGNRVASFVKLNAKVVAVEPQHDCCIFLEERFGKKVSVLRNGIGESRGELDLYIGESNILSTFAKDRVENLSEGRFSQHQWKKSGSIPIITLEDLIEKYGQPSFIKIDVEGMELEVLKGLRSPVKGISFEYTVPEETSKLINCVRQLIAIDKRYEFNYSVGESMSLQLEKWITAEEILAHIETSVFLETSWGDVYCRNPNL